MKQISRKRALYAWMKKYMVVRRRPTPFFLIDTGTIPVPSEALQTALAYNRKVRVVVQTFPTEI